MGGGGPVAAITAAAPVLNAVSTLVAATNVPAAPQPVIQQAPVAPAAPVEQPAAEPQGVLDQERLRARALRRQAQSSQRQNVNALQEQPSESNTLLGS